MTIFVKRKFYMPNTNCIEESIECLENRTNKLINQYISSLDTIEKQKFRIEELSEKLNGEREKAKLLKERLDTVLLADSMAGRTRGADTEFKQTNKIDKLVREIEKCIALLNK